MTDEGPLGERQKIFQGGSVNIAIRKLSDIRLNVKPVFAVFYRGYVFERPCRFAGGEGLTRKFDLV